MAPSQLRRHETIQLLAVEPGHKQLQLFQLLGVLGMLVDDGAPGFACVPLVDQCHNLRFLELDDKRPEVGLASQFARRLGQVHHLEEQRIAIGKANADRPWRIAIPIAPFPRELRILKIAEINVVDSHGIVDFGFRISDW